MALGLHGTGAVKPLFVAVFFLCFTASSLLGDWTLGAAGGPFIFGHFAERSITLGNGETRRRDEYALSASTRAGGRLDLEHNLNDRLAIRLEGSFTQSPLAVKTRSSGARPGSGSTSLNVGRTQVTAFALPLVWRLNRGGSIRPFLALGPALVRYDFTRESSTLLVPLFTGSRVRAGVEAVGGAEWWVFRRLAITGDVRDIFTRSPLLESDLQGTRSGALTLSNVHNVQTAVGLRVKF